MRSLPRTARALLVLLALAGCSTPAGALLAAAAQPPAPRIAHVDVLHGIDVPDPYRWLEETEAPSVKAWVAEERELSRRLLDGLPARAHLGARIAELSRVEGRTLPERHGDWYYWRWNDGTLDQALLVRGRSPASHDEVVLDPRTWSPDGSVALVDLSFSPSGALLAFALSDAGSDWRELRVLDLETRREHSDRLRWVKFNTPAWTADEAGFYYGRYPAADDPLRATAERMRLCYHRLGAPQSADVVALEEPEHPRRGFGPTVTEDGRWLVLSVWEGAAARNRLYLRDLSRTDAPFVRLFDDLDAAYSLVGSRGTTLWLRTTRDAPTGRIARVDVAAQDPELHTVVPADVAPIGLARLAGGRLVVERMRDVMSELAVFELDGSPLGAVALPGEGTVLGLTGREGADEVFFGYTNALTPVEHWRLDVRTLASELAWRPEVPFDPAPHVSERHFYTSADGTRVPLVLTRPRGADRDGALATALYGYGGFNVSPRPAFDPGVAAWLELGGASAVAHVRGGGEYGAGWHRAGTKERKQTVFDDFIAAAEYLVQEGWTRPARLAVRGSSNGGLLVGAVLNQRPELFGAAVPSVGVLDMLRYHRFTVGWAWAGEYGTADDPELFDTLRAYSPYHNVRDGARYPATLVMTAEGDDRVVPAHSFKYAAALRAAQGGPAPVLLRVEERAGHGAGRSTSQRLEEAADEWAFLAAALGLDGRGAATAPRAGQ